jgi:toxin YoeB
MSWELIWTKSARDDLAYFAKTNKKTAIRILKIVESMQNDPFGGIGKPEPLKFAYTGKWSRRVDKVNRIIYSIEKDSITIYSVRYHYE